MIVRDAFQYIVGKPKSPLASISPSQNDLECGW